MYVIFCNFAQFFVKLKNCKMKIPFHLTAFAAVIIASMASCKSRQMVQTKSPERSIVILYDNDVHCGIEGYARMAGLRDAVRDTAWCALVSSGDYLQGGTAGAISKGQYIADIMRNMNYDAATLGNHEFDYSVPRMMELIASAKLPVTCANLYNTASGKRVFPSYIMKTYGNRKVAFIGATTTGTLYTESYAFYDENGGQMYDLSEKDVYKHIQKAADDARADGADYVIVLAHLGETPNTLNCDSHGLVAATRGIDAVLDGHTHSVIECAYVENLDGKKIPVTQTGTKFQHVGKLLIDNKGNFTPHLIPLSEIKQENSTVKATTDSIVAEMSVLTDRPVCHSDYPLRILNEEGKQLVRMAETNAGDLVTDAYRALSKADIAITNGGGIRTELPAGDLKYGDIVSLLPYDNYLCVVEISGAELLDLLEACCKDTPVENGNFPQSSGMSFTINTKASPRVSDLKVLDGATGEYLPVIADKKYSLATIDYCITGGGLEAKLRNAKMLKENICRYNDALVTYVTEILGGKIPERYAEPQGRITIK